MTEQLANTIDQDQKEQDNKICFADLNLHPAILKALDKSGYTHPTPIQSGAIPHATAGRDLLLSAQTGSGKTAAFVLPVLDALAKHSAKAKITPEAQGEFSQKSHNRYQKPMIKALILTPTRELAMQVQDNVRKYGSQLKGIFSVPLVGGAPYGGQIRALRKGVQIIIATPGRLIDHMNDGRVDLSELDTLILDEADRMLDMGFADAIKTILEAAPTERQTIMSSATWDGAVGKIAESFTVNPEKISIKVESAHIDESVYFCDDFHHKNNILVELLNNSEINQAVIFTATKRSTEQLAERLVEAGLKARYLHGDLPQGKRNRIIADVKSGKCDFLIATDVAARGIDISAISHVVNYDLPRQVEDYVHRIGRCGRAGRTGVAMNLCSMDDRGQLRNINRYLKRNMKEAVIEGLEPKRPAMMDEEGGRKKGRNSRGERAERGFGKGGRGRGFDRRREFHQEEKSFNQESRYRPFDENFAKDDRHGLGGKKGFAKGRFEQDHQTRGYGEKKFDVKNRHQLTSHQYEERFDHRHEHKRFENQRFESKPYGAYGNAKRGERFDDYPSERQSRQFGEKSYGATRQKAGGQGRGFGNKSANGGFGRSDFASKPAKTSHTRKSRPVEEVFFAKRQEKKAKRKFGND